MEKLQKSMNSNVIKTLQNNTFNS